MKLFTKDINQKLFAQYRIGSNLNNQKVVAKIFNPYGRGRWYLLNSDPNDPDYLWAIVQMGDEVEIGSVSRSELESVRIKPYNLPLERDMYFNERNAMEVLDGLEKGQTFAHGGMTAGRWYKDTSGNELRYIGESDGRLLFNDGEKLVYKSHDDFEEESPKERKLFGFFEDGGETSEMKDDFLEDIKETHGAIKEITLEDGSKVSRKEMMAAHHNLKQARYGAKLVKGGDVKFKEKVKVIEKSLLKRKKVSPSVQKDYGKTYNKKEAHESAQRIVGAQKAKYDLLSKLKKKKK